MMRLDANGNVSVRLTLAHIRIAGLDDPLLQEETGLSVTRRYGGWYLVTGKPAALAALADDFAERAKPEAYDMNATDRRASAGAHQRILAALDEESR